ncbi:MAG TPA: DUF4167 domain-containing protein [Sphingomicrobium sp.]|nr:DUF4167 domain-containing protein [Sphingomicrobium sp.]
MPGNSGGNARDNRQRGNATQLLEKYKSLARDAQLAGDRVQTEYYLQYADHYFRVLEDSRSRFEEQQAQRRPRRDDDDYEIDSDGDEELTADAGDEDEGETEARQRPDRDRGRERGRDRFDRDERDERPRQGRANGVRRDSGDDSDGDDRIALVLPPAIGGSAANSEQVEDDAPKLRRRIRKPRADDGGDEDVAPAA